MRADTHSVHVDHLALDQWREISVATYDLLVEFLRDARDEAIRNGLPVVAGEAQTLLVLLGSGW